MSCNGCRILRKGCSESCILRPCLQWIDSPESQSHATVFVAKFFGRAGLMSFLSNVPPLQRPALFQSLLYEACGRTVNPVTGAVGLLWSGNWHLCQAAVDTVLRGGTLRPIPDFIATAPPPPTTTADTDDASEVVHSPNATWQPRSPPPRFTNSKRRKSDSDSDEQTQLNLTLTPTFPHAPPHVLNKRPGTPSEESATTVDQHFQLNVAPVTRLLNLFV